MTMRAPGVTASRIVLAFGTVYLLWGSTYLAIRIAVQEVPPFLAAGLRFLLAGILYLAWARLSHARWPTPRQWFWAGLTGFMLCAIGNGGVNLAETRVASGVAALVIGTIPLWLSIFDAARPRGNRFTWRVGAGVALGLVGVGVLAAPDPTQPIDRFGIVVLLVASVGWAAASVIAKHTDMPASVPMMSAAQMLVGGFGLLVMSALRRETQGWDPGAVSMQAYAAIAYLVVFGSLVAFTAYMWLLRHLPASAVGSYAYVNPIVAVLLGAWILDEPLHGRLIAATALIVAAAALLTWKRMRRKEAAPGQATPADAAAAPASAPGGAPPSNEPASGA